MAESFDAVTWIKDFEQVNGRPPTSQEVEEAQNLISRYTTEQEMNVWTDESQTIDETIEPSPQNRWEALNSKSLGWFWKTLLIIISTPIYLIRFFFNLIKAGIGVFVIWFVAKLVLLAALAIGLSLANIENPNDVPGVIKWFGELLFGKNVFQSSSLLPNFFPHESFDGWLIGILIVIFALFFTFSNYNKQSNM
ncbi:hypothetical protein [Streptococcus sobrinus]|uniref:hypothetical protein n=1 Tax=Streptococcus sobrinus TaxID=1310 RepID=UPI0002D31CBF|nr:hypothetical protein [Streptococcus sobrinus]